MRRTGIDADILFSDGRVFGHLAGEVHREEYLLIGDTISICDLNLHVVSISEFVFEGLTMKTASLNTIVFLDDEIAEITAQTIEDATDHYIVRYSELS